MATLYEYYNTGDTFYLAFYGDRWEAQSFTPLVSHTITSVKIKAYRYGNPGILTCEIYATNGSGFPTGEPLCSGTIDADTFTDVAPGDWYEIFLGDGAPLNADIKYAIVLHCGGDSSNFVYWRVDDETVAYDRGSHLESHDAGDSWDDLFWEDMMFEDWGEPLAPPGLENKSALMAAKMIAGKLI